MAGQGLPRYPVKKKELARSLGKLYSLHCSHGGFIMTKSTSGASPKTHPILMSAPMVLALLQGRKTQTRRIIKPQPVPIPDDVPQSKRYDNGWWWASNTVQSMVAVPEMGGWCCPYGQPGDLLWVKETWHHGDAWYPDLAWKNRHVEGKGWTWVDYRATFNDAPDFDRDFAWKPSIYMPRWASRLTLEITGVRVERLRNISEGDAYAEGVTIPSHHAFASNGSPELRNEARCVYRSLWESINGPASWDANPWVWVLEFLVRKVNVDDLLKAWAA